MSTKEIWKRLLPWLRRRPVRTAAAGYAVLVLFSVAAAVARWPASASPNAALIIGGVIVAPLALAWLGDRITGVKLSGFELSLADVTVRVDADTTTAVMTIATTGGSGSPELLEAFQAAIRGRYRVLQIDLRDDNYWWSTRLYLVAALAAEYTDVEHLIFVHRANQFIGGAPPPAVWRRLAERIPGCDVAYRRMRVGLIGQVPLLARDEELKQILVQAWSAQFAGGEVQSKEIVTAEALCEWLRGILDTDSLPDGPLTPLLQYQIVSRPERYTALTTADQLKHVIDRDALAARVTEALLRRQLS